MSSETIVEEQGTKSVVTASAAVHATTGYPIRWRVHYEDESGSLVEKGPYTSSLPDVKADPDEPDKDEADKTPSVFDIVIHVTIGDIVATEEIKTTEAATEAGKEDRGDEVTANAGETTKNNKQFRIRSVDSSEMVVRSPSLVKAIQTVITYCPGQDIAGETITFAEPYLPLLHHQNALEQYFQNLEENEAPDSAITSTVNGVPNGVPKGKISVSTARNDWSILRAFLDAKWKKKIDKEEARHQQSPPVATFEMLWMLFKPGTRVFHNKDEEISGCIVRSIKLLDPLKEEKRWQVCLWSLGFNGKLSKYSLLLLILTIRVGNYVDRVPSEHVMRGFDGTREITTLDVYPVQLPLDGIDRPLNPQRKQELEKRGKYFWDLVQEISQKKFVQVKYSGKFLDIEQDVSLAVCVTFSG